MLGLQAHVTMPNSLSLMGFCLFFLLDIEPHISQASFELTVVAEEDWLSDLSASVAS